MSSVNQLDPYFQSLISNIMLVEREPIDRLSQKQAELNVQRGVYLDVRSTLKDLQNAASALSVSLTPGAFTPGRKASITNAPTGLTVLSAATGSSAVTGTYDVAVTQLAQAQRRVSAEQASTDMALGKSGTFWLGGSGTAGAALTGNSTLSGAGTGSVASGQSELGAGTYTVETREVNGAKQFRLKNADGNTVTIADATGRYTNEWQALTTGTFDTKRGLTLDFTGDAANASTTVN
jgi:flagellar hook-associated protein 2